MDRPQPNPRLKLQRSLRGWSQENVAAGLHRLAASLGERELGVDATMVGRWERGTRKPRPRYVRLLSRLFELPAEQLGMVEESDLDRPAEHGQRALAEDDLDRRGFMRGVGALLSLAAVPVHALGPLGPEPWERLSGALRLPRVVDERTVAQLEQTTIALESLGPAQVSSHALIGPVIGQLDAISMILQGSTPASLRARLCSLAGETAGLAGWLRWNVDDPDGAAAYFRTGLDAAKEAGDRALGAYLMGSAACQPPYRGNFEERLRSLQGQVHGFTRSDASPATQVWLAAKEADARAHLGDADGCLRALARAEAMFERVGGDAETERPRFTSVDSAWLTGERGASLAKLGRTGEARTLLESVISRLGPARERDRLWLLTALASAHLQDSEPEEACRVAREALDGSLKIQLKPILRVVEGLRRDLQAFGPRPALQELDEHLRLTLGVD